MSFADVTRLEELKPGRYRARFDPSWGQGRALFGGIQAAALVRGFETLGMGDGRALRTLAVHFCRAAAPGELDVEVAIERMGRYVTQASGRLLQADEEGMPRTVVTSLATYVRPRGGEERVRPGTVSPGTCLPQELPPPECLPRVETSPQLPQFLEHVDMRWASAPPFAGADDPVAEGWCRFLDPGPADAALLAGLLDIWPPAVLAVLPSPRLSASIDLRYDVFVPFPPPEVAGDDFFAFRCRAFGLEDGYSVDEGELWTRDGRPVARIRQLRVVF